jgi:eukaryotic-like serine/threonine-protein kinase
MMTAVYHRFGHYEISREVGRGGMAVVFLATDTRHGQQVALKTVPQGTDREAREIFEAEQSGAELQQQFSRLSTHVPAVYEHGVDPSGYFYVAMEYLDGENLSDVISRGPLSVDRAVRIAMELCDFLDRAHHFEAVVAGRQLRSLVHGDLKPRNVRITSDGVVKVLDFGIAKALSLSRKVTRNDFGSIAYLSPERLESGEVDGHADFWALGVLLYEMLAGAPPFQAPDTRRLERQIVSRVPPPSLAQRCPRGLEAIVAKLLAPTPSERYASAAEIRADLDRYHAGASTLASQEGWPERVHDDATRRTRDVAAADDEKTRRTRAPEVPPIAAATSSVAAAAGAAAAVATPATRRAPKKRRWFRSVLLVLALAFVVNEIRVSGAASRLAGELATREIDELGAVWNEFAKLSRRSYLGMATADLERSLVDRTTELADRVVANYRTPTPTVRENQWRVARDVLARAVVAKPNDRRLRAALRYCEGHLHRINGEARKSRRELPDAHRELTDAVAAFREAAELRPGWPDPFLGLMRTFVYGLEDVERGADALKQAERHGHKPTERETAQLADGYRFRANTLVRNARQLAGMPQEREYLTRAAEAYRRSLELYATATAFPNVTSNIRLSQRALTQVEERLDALSVQPPAEVMVP